MQASILVLQNSVTDYENKIKRWEWEQRKRTKERFTSCTYTKDDCSNMKTVRKEKLVNNIS